MACSKIRFGQCYPLPASTTAAERDNLPPRMRWSNLPQLLVNPPAHSNASSSWASRLAPTPTPRETHLGAGGSYRQGVDTAYFPWVPQPAQEQLGPQEQSDPHMMMGGGWFERPVSFAVQKAVMSCLRDGIKRGKRGSKEGLRVVFMSVSRPPLRAGAKRGPADPLLSTQSRPTPLANQQYHQDFVQ